MRQNSPGYKTHDFIRIVTKIVPSSQTKWKGGFTIMLQSLGFLRQDYNQLNSKLFEFPEHRLLADMARIKYFHKNSYPSLYPLGKLSNGIYVDQVIISVFILGYKWKI